MIQIQFNHICEFHTPVCSCMQNNEQLHRKKNCCERNDKAGKLSEKKNIRRVQCARKLMCTS